MQGLLLPPPSLYFSRDDVFTCANHDPTPRLFVLNCIRFHELGVLTSLQFLSDLGLLPRRALLALPAPPPAPPGGDAAAPPLPPRCTASG